MRGQQQKTVWLGQSMAVLALLTASAASAETRWFTMEGTAKTQPLTPLKPIPFSYRVMEKTVP